MARMTYIDKKRAEEEARKNMSLADLVKTTKKGYDLFTDLHTLPGPITSSSGSGIVGSAPFVDSGPGYLLSSGTTVPAPAVGVEAASAPMVGVGPTPLSQIAGGLGVAGGAYGVYQGIKDKNPVMAGLGGGGISMGLSTLGYAIPGWGTAAMVAAPVVMSLLNKWGDKDAWKTEQDRLGKLSGMVGWDEYANQQPKLTKGRSRGELAAIEEAKTANGQYGNSKFAKSRDEKDLQGKDIWGYSAFGEKFGNDWFGKFDENQREQIANAALGQNAVKEHHGTVDVNWSPALMEAIDKIIEGNQTAFYK